MDKMQGKVCLVTGATDGIGKVTALTLAQRGAKVVGVGRNPDKIAAVLREAESPNLEFLQADLSSMTQVRALVQAFKARYAQLHILVNNAGASFPSYRESAEGIEMTFALNHLSYFLLTTLLLELLKRGAPARVINVSSSAHRHAGLNLDQINNPEHYHSWGAYSASKFANVLFTYELARRLADQQITVNAVHPGFVDTNFFNAAEMTGMRGHLTPEQGADTQIWLATEESLTEVTGKFFVNRVETATIPESYDLELARRLWEASERLVQRT